MNTPTPCSAASFHVRFKSLFLQGRAMEFPCDAHGLVDIGGLSERARNNYLFARAMVGRDYAPPCVCGADAPSLPCPA